MFKAGEIWEIQVTGLFRDMGSKRLTFSCEAQVSVLRLCMSYLPVAAFKNTVCN